MTGWLGIKHQVTYLLICCFVLLKGKKLWFPEHRQLNGLNLPTHDRKHQLRARELIGQAANLVGELTQGLSNFFTYSEQRSRIYPADGVTEPLSPTNTKVAREWI